MKVAFVINDLQLSGGVGVVVAHARQLHDRHDMDVTLVLAREQNDPHWDHTPLEGLRIATLAQARADHFDVALSTWWETAHALFQLNADRYAAFVQSLEDRFYRDDEPERMGAAIALDLPVAFITEAGWIRDTLAELRPDATCHLVHNGIDKAVFTPPDEVPRNDDGPLRVLVEGYASVWFKGVNDAIAAVGKMSEPHTLTVVAADRDGLEADGADRVVGPISQREMSDLYGDSDVVLKLSRIEGMYGPPLEGFHRGATCVTTEVTGHEEYIEHGVNALVCDWDDPLGTARQLDLLARDRELLHSLRSAALETARAWPSWEQAGDEMAAALRAIAAAPPPSPYAHAERLLADVRAAMETHRLQLRYAGELAYKARQLDRIKALPGVRHYLRVKSSRPARAVKRLGGSGRRKPLGP